MSEKTEVKKEELSRAQTSPVWSYFKICEDNPVLADCMLCGIRMSRGGSAPNRCGTTNLRRHILYSHNIELPSAYKKRSTIDYTTRDSSKKTLKEKTKKKSPLVLNKIATRKKTLQGLKKSSSPTDVKKKEQQIKEEHETQMEPVMCIKWNTYLSNMTSALPHLLEDEQFVDVTLACEGQSLKCHKILLAACSPYFYELLSTASCRHPIIMFKDYHFWELQVLVAFMYCGEVNVPQSQLPRILRVAEALQIKGLAKPASKAEPPPVNEHQLSNEADNTQPTGTPQPQEIDSKRKRKPSSHNCCKNSPKTTTSKHKSAAAGNNRGKLKPKKKGTPSPPKRLKLSPGKKRSPKKHLSVPKKESPKRVSENVTPLFPSPLEQNCSQLPELLHSDMPDMLSDILAMKDTAGITEGISLPVAHRVGSVDGIFPLVDLEEMKMGMDEDGPEIGPFLANGLHHADEFDLLPHLNPECRLDEDEEDGR